MQVTLNLFVSLPFPFYLVIYSLCSILKVRHLISYHKEAIYYLSYGPMFIINFKVKRNIFLLLEPTLTYSKVDT